MKATDAERLRNEYRSLVEGLVEQGLLPGGGGGRAGGGGAGEGAGVNGNGGAAPPAAPRIAPTDATLGSAVLSSDVINEAVPGNIRKAEHFVAFLKKLVEHLKSRLEVVASSSGGVVSESPVRFLHHLKVSTSLEVRSC